MDLRHVGLYNDELAHAIQEQPGEILPLVRDAWLVALLRRPHTISSLKTLPRELPEQYSFR